MKYLVALVLLMATVSASAMLISPKQITMNMGNYTPDNIYYLGEFDLGRIAPGQTLELVFTRNTGQNGTESSASIFWEKATAPAELMPQTEITATDLTMSLKIPEDKRGNLIFNVTLEGIEIGTIAPHTMTLKLQVTESVFSYSYEQRHYLYAGEPEQIPLTITSSSAGKDTLIFSDIEGIPSGWLSNSPAQIAPFEQKQIMLTVIPNEEGYFEAKINVGRTSSSLKDTNPLVLRVYPTFQSKLRAFGEGFSIIPVLLQPLYSLLSMFGLA
jgi:hypothetical protein